MLFSLWLLSQWVSKSLRYLPSALTWQHAFSASGNTLANPWKLQIGIYPCVSSVSSAGDWHPWILLQDTALELGPSFLYQNLKNRTKGRNSAKMNTEAPRTYDEMVVRLQTPVQSSAHRTPVLMNPNRLSALVHLQTRLYMVSARSCVHKPCTGSVCSCIRKHCTGPSTSCSSSSTMHTFTFSTVQSFWSKTDSEFNLHKLFKAIGSSGCISMVCAWQQFEVCYLRWQALSRSGPMYSSIIWVIRSTIFCFRKREQFRSNSFRSWNEHPQRQFWFFNRSNACDEQQYTL